MLSNSSSCLKLDGFSLASFCSICADLCIPAPTRNACTSGYRSLAATLAFLTTIVDLLVSVRYLGNDGLGSTRFYDRFREVF